MMRDRRKKNVNWAAAEVDGNLYVSIKHGVIVAILMDIRDELQKLNRTLDCPNFQNLPFKLDRIARATASTRTTVGRIATRVAPKRKGRRQVR